jgi:hypothetical protein
VGAGTRRTRRRFRVEAPSGGGASFTPSTADR